MPPRLSLSRCASALGVLTGLLICTTGCRIPSSNAQPRGRPGTPDPDQPVAVQTLRTQASAPVSGLTYTGTTRPIQQVAIKAQVAGRITVLPVDIGDRVIAGQVLAQLDGDLQTATVNQEQAELSARRAEAAQTNVAIIDAQAAVVQAEAALTQAQNDANRLRRLANQGALSEQTAEAAALDLISAQQVLNSAQAQVTARQQTAASAKERINAQQAVVDQSQVRLAYAALSAPLSGVVLTRPLAVGDYAASGATLLELGDLSTLKVTVQVSELDLGQLTPGQPAQIQLDAFPGQGTLSGRISRISPVADTTSRLVPVEVTVPNPDGRIGSGLLARVQFTPNQGDLVSLPASALTLKEGPDSVSDNTVFVVDVIADGTNVGGTNVDGTNADSTNTPTAVARSVTVGARTTDQVEILSGLSPGESVIIQSSRPLTDGQEVRLSILSED